MGMSIGGGEDEPMMDINTTPLIDILLVLLIMFIITIPVMTHAVKLDMPQGNPNAPLTPPVVINLDITFDGTVLWNGNVVPSIDTLDGYFRREAAMDPQPELHIHPNKRANYDVVARVLAAAQRNGLLKIGMVGAEEFM